ncbi:MAG: DUF2225 domain-containing protein [Chloroflexota bacterium]
MTTLVPKQIECAVCGEQSEQTVVGSSSSFGAPDLDGRPPALLRYTISYWVQRCPSCGYCAPRIAEPSVKATEVMGEVLYQTQLHNHRFPVVANSFLCAAFIQEQQEQLADAGWSCVYAAWVCDDERNTSAAQQCRRKAIALLQQATDAGEQIYEDPEQAALLLTDLMRRAGEFAAAAVHCQQMLAQSLSPLVQHILTAQQALITRRDMAGYTVEEAIGESTYRSLSEQRKK